MSVTFWNKNKVQGVAASGTAVSGNPVLTGGEATTDIPSDVDSGDAASLSLTLDRLLRVLNFTKEFSATPTDVNTTYNDTTTEATSASIDTSGNRQATISYTAAVANGPDNFQIIIQTSNDGGTTWFDMAYGILGTLFETDNSIGSGIDRAYDFDLPCTGEIRVKVVAEGTTSTNTFTISNMKIHFRP